MIIGSCHFGFWQLILTHTLEFYIELYTRILSTRLYSVFYTFLIYMYLLSWIYTRNWKTYTDLDTDLCTEVFLIFYTLDFRQIYWILTQGSIFLTSLHVVIYWDVIFTSHTVIFIDACDVYCDLLCYVLWSLICDMSVMFDCLVMWKL